MTVNKKIIIKVLLVAVLLTAMLALTGCEMASISEFRLPDISLPINTGSEVVDTIINVVWHILAYGVLAVVAVVVGVWLVVHAAIAGVIGLVVWLITLLIQLIFGFKIF